MGEKTEKTDAYDPFEVWRGMRDSAMDAWSKAMMQAVNTDAYAKATAAMLDTYLAASGPFREIVEKSMTQMLQQLSMPTRDDVLSLSQRLTNIEMRLDDIEAKLDAAEQQRRAESSTAGGTR